MIKYRIKVEEGAASDWFYIERRFFWIWFEVDVFFSLRLAEKALRNLTNPKYIYPKQNE